MPDIAVFHPQIVHFVVALLFVGVAFRVFSLPGKPKWLSPAATVLILLGTAASVAAVKSGTDAHGPVERIPGARPAVVEHEEWGERTRNLFLAVAAIELIGLAFLKKDKATRYIRMGSALVGIAGCAVLYEAAEHGGHLVYQYAGGVGTRSGDRADVTRLLIAGLYNEAQLQRSAGHAADAARLTEEMWRARPDDPELRMAYAQSLMSDLHNPQATLEQLSRISVAADDRSTDIRKGMLAADAWEALGMPDSARAILAPLVDRYPTTTRLRARLDSIR